MQYQIETIMGEANEYVRRRNRLALEDQARADYLLRRLSHMRETSWIIALYWGVAGVLALLGVPALWNLIAFGIKDFFEVAGSIAFIFWTTIGFITYYIWLRPRRRRLINKFRYELATDSRLRRVFEDMGFVDP
jgi:hypothetical protein